MFELCPEYAALYGLALLETPPAAVECALPIHCVSLEEYTCPLTAEPLHEQEKDRV